MKKTLLILLAAGIRISLQACPRCQLQQSRWTRGLVHGRGPDGQWEYLILALSMVIFLYTLYHSIRYLVRPGEKNDNHIKNYILNDE